MRGDRGHRGDHSEPLAVTIRWDGLGWLVRSKLEVGLGLGPGGGDLLACDEARACQEASSHVKKNETTDETPSREADDAASSLACVYEYVLSAADGGV